MIMFAPTTTSGIRNSQPRIMPNMMNAASASKDISSMQFHIRVLNLNMSYFFPDFVRFSVKFPANSVILTDFLSIRTLRRKTSSLV